MVGQWQCLILVNSRGHPCVPFDAGEEGKFNGAVNRARSVKQQNATRDEYIGVNDPADDLGRRKESSLIASRNSGHDGNFDVLGGAQLLPSGSEVMQNANTRLGSRDLLFDGVKAGNGQL